ncbi:MAG: alcohol dehydrogenase, propanol-preferring [Mycobacterium sp.]|nr:alcohol dehydrogenase, propanol-preferring [Mycobacterium sp.]
MSTYHAYEVSGQREFDLVERELVSPAAGQVRLRVLSCGVCHTDAISVEGMRPNPAEPVVPGHEIVGVIDALGDGVTQWAVGQRVGVGYLGGPCGVCHWCRLGDFVNCENQPFTGQTVDGGYAEVVYARASGLVRIPDALGSMDASPLLCAGITTYNPLRALDADAGALVAVQGIGGLGHLGIQYAKKLDYRVAAIARGAEKEPLATKLGADHYIDSSAVDPAHALQELGGAVAIIATASRRAISSSSSALATTRSRLTASP